MPRAVLPTGIELEYDEIGDTGDRPLVLIAGLGAQMITWHDDFCARLAGQGFRVIRFDNRDVGLSSKIEDGSSYVLRDMAGDVGGLLDLLGVDAAHIVGASMGGMIAQQFAIDHAGRALSLTSIYSTTGRPGVGTPTPEAFARLTVQTGPTREERIASSIATSRVIWADTAQYPFDEELARWRAEASVDRCYYPVGTARQLVAIQASGDRTEALGRLGVPALVIHGSADPLVTISGGHATAEAIPGAELLVLEGMGHVVHPLAWDEIVEAIAKVAARAGG